MREKRARIAFACVSVFYTNATAGLHTERKCWTQFSVSEIDFEKCRRKVEISIFKGTKELQRYRGTGVQGYRGAGVFFRRYTPPYLQFSRKYALSQFERLFSLTWIAETSSIHSVLLKLQNSSADAFSAEKTTKLNLTSAVLYCTVQTVQYSTRYEWHSCVSIFIKGR